MNFLTWERGRQENGGREYFKMLLLQSARWHFDCYLLSYPETTGLVEHVDTAPPGFEHHRINIILRKPKVGGIFVCENAYVNTSRVKYFRPDIHPHSVTECNGRRLVLSIGWLKIGKKTTR